MSFTTYAELQTTIAGYLARSDLTTQIPDFIRLAEIRLRRDLRIRQMLTSTTITYTVLASTFKLAPVPDTGYTLTLIYSAAPPYLSDSNTSNTFMTVCPDLLLYASLLEAEPYLMNDARINTWGTMFDRAMSALTTSDEQGQYSGVPLSMQTTYS
jgi:hypothetical protein